MHRIDGPGATNDNQFTEGDPTQGIPATTVTGAWLNAIQEEIAGVIEGAGDTLDKPDNNQLLAAIQAIIAGSQVSAFNTGDVKLTLASTAPTGWIMADDGTIGDAGSGATTRENADTEALFTVIWDNVADAYAPVAGGRGASAAADFAAGKTITLTRMLGRSLGVAGAGASLTSRQLGQFLGDESVTLTEAQLPSHDHAAGGLSTNSTGSHTHGSGSLSASSGGNHYHQQFKDGTTGSNELTNANYPSAEGNIGAAGNYIIQGVGTSPDNGRTSTAGAHTHSVSGNTGSNGSHSHTISGNTGNAGSGSAHGNMQPTSFLNAMIKL